MSSGSDFHKHFCQYTFVFVAFILVSLSLTNLTTDHVLHTFILIFLLRSSHLLANYFNPNGRLLSPSRGHTCVLGWPLVGDIPSDREGELASPELSAFTLQYSNPYSLATSAWRSSLEVNCTSIKQLMKKQKYVERWSSVGFNWNYFNNETERLCDTTLRKQWNWAVQYVNTIK